MGGGGLRGLMSAFLPSCVTLGKCLPVSGPPFTDWGTDASLQGYWQAWPGIQEGLGPELGTQ